MCPDDYAPSDDYAFPYGYAYSLDTSLMPRHKRKSVVHQIKFIKEMIYLIRKTKKGLKWTKSPQSLEYKGASDIAQVDLDNMWCMYKCFCLIV